MHPHFSIIVPVINEEAVINSTIEHLETLDASAYMEIIVVDGDRSGNTIGVIRN